MSRDMVLDLQAFRPASSYEKVIEDKFHCAYTRIC